MNILVVDDQPIALKLLRLQLEAGGDTVAEATDGLEALDVLRRLKVDAIVSDIRMPRMDGFRLCTEVRAGRRTRRVPFIAYSAADSSAGDERMLMELGADCFLRKPTSAAAVASMLRKVTGAEGRRSPPPLNRRGPVPGEEELLVALRKENAALADRIDRQTQASDGLQAANEQLRRVLEHNPAMIYGSKWESEKIVLRLLSGNIAEFLGFDHATAVSFDWWTEQIFPADRAGALAGTAEAMAKGFSRIEYRLLHRDGTLRWVEDHCRVSRGPVSGSVEFSGVWTDITERKRAEQMAEEQHEQLETVVATAMNALLAIQDDRVVLVNFAAIRLLAAADETQLVGREMRSFLNEEDFPLIVARSRLGLQEQGNLQPLLEQQMRRVDGSIVNVELSSARFRFDGRPALLVEARDLSERKLAEGRLALQRAVAEALTDLTYPTRVCEKILEVIADGMGWELGEFWTVDRKEKTLQCTDTWHLPSTGLRDIAAMSRGLVFNCGEGAPGSVWASARTEWSANLAPAETCPRVARARSVGLSGWVGFPLKSGAEVVGVLGFFCRKLTRPDPELLKLFETFGLQIGQYVVRQQLAAQFSRGQKMEALGVLSAGIAHDFNNILTAICGYGAQAQEAAVGNGPLTEMLDGLMHGARRASTLVGQILSFSRCQEEERRPVLLSPVVTEAMRLLRVGVPKAIEFKLALSQDVPVVLANITQIHQVLMNLGINAAYAMRGQDGQLAVTLEAAQITPALAATTPGLHAGLYARLRVTDNGPGMDAATLNQTFNPFFTTKPPGEGTGLGLSIVHDIVENHGGAIVVSSARGVGTTFEIYLPAHVASEPTAAINESPRGTSSRRQPIEPFSASLPPSISARVLDGEESAL